MLSRYQVLNFKIPRDILEYFDLTRARKEKSSLVPARIDQGGEVPFSSESSTVTDCLSLSNIVSHLRAIQRPLSNGTRCLRRKSQCSRHLPVFPIFRFSHLSLSSDLLIAFLSVAFTNECFESSLLMSTVMSFRASRPLKLLMSAM